MRTRNGTFDPKGDVNGRDHDPYGVRDRLGNAPDD
jgi:hypothetical protein